MSPSNESSHTQLPDHAGVAFRPPIMLLVFLLLGFGLRAIFPLSLLPDPVARIVGPVVVGSAFAFFFWAISTMRGGGGSIPTGEPTEVIINKGPYRHSRNPIYVSMIALLIGVGVWANSLWLVGLAGLSAFLLWWGVISREEAYLERKFGSGYIAYKTLVRRWL